MFRDENFCLVVVFSNMLDRVGLLFVIEYDDVNMGMVLILVIRVLIEVGVFCICWVWVGLCFEGVDFFGFLLLF